MKANPAKHNARSFRGLWGELVIALRFGVVGVAATAIHIGVLLLLIVNTNIPLLSANAVAFCCAFVCSFTGNYYWTFQYPGNRVRAIVRFMVIALSAFILNMLLLNWLAQKNWMADVYTGIAAIIIVPVITFLGSRLWGFR
ncbi:MAG: GtrA family protein [Haliea sp.]